MSDRPPRPPVDDADRLVAVLSDTHLPGRGRTIPDRAVEIIRSADLVIHAGDVCDAPTLMRLRAIGPPLVAVHGNVDDDEVRAALPATVEVNVGGVRIGVVHDGGHEAGRLRRLRRRFPSCDAVVFGHSHIPLHAVADGFHIINPGSAADRRRQPHHSMAVVRVAGGTITGVTHLNLDSPGDPLDPALVRRNG